MGRVGPVVTYAALLLAVMVARSIGRDFGKAMDISMSEEEKAAMQADMAAGGSTAATDTVVNPPLSPSAASVNGESSTTKSYPNTASASRTADVISASPSTSLPQGTDLNKSKTSPTPPATSARSPQKSSNKLTPEQRKQMDDLATERRKNEVDRIQLLTNKLKERVRPFVQSKNPGDASDPECIRWEERIRAEIEDLKGESFGLELCRLIGQIVSVLFFLHT